MNRLLHEHSPYLRHAAKQKVDWYPWSEEPFARARSEGKPVFLSIGAVWCHWCHVMAAESFENDEIAGIMNRLFINIKLDRDEHPDIDRSYQQAVAAMGAGSGWPLSVFLTPDKEPFYGGTYYPPEDMKNRPGFKSVLKAVAAFYSGSREDAAAFGEKILNILQPEPLHSLDLKEDMLNEAEKAILSGFDSENGGFGSSPKFPMAGALEFLLRRAEEGSEAAAKAVRKTLTTMALGGFHDQLGGGFHRYSVDEAWIIPHFEKMADDNAGLIKHYVDGYALFGDERFRAVATGILDFTREVLSDPEGGFYASQDADVSVHDEGGYFTWTAAELEQVLSKEEYQAVSLHLLHPRGRLSGGAGKNVLALSENEEAIAKKTGESAETVRKRIQSAKAKLLAVRRKRKPPFVDSTLYTSLNGMLIAAYLHAFMLLDDFTTRDFGLKSLDRILRERIVGKILYHAPGVPALLDDYVHLIDALLSAYEATAESRYLVQGDELMTACRGIFFDDMQGGFFEIEKEILGARLKRIEDVPHASPNGVAIGLLLKLAFMTGKNEYHEQAVRSLKLFAESARTMGIHAGTYFCALNDYYHMVALTIQAHPESILARSARSFAARFRSPIVYGPDENRVVPCSRETCYEPLSDFEGLSRFFVKQGRFQL